MEEATAKVESILHQPHLPHDLIAQHILKKLPIKSVLQFKCVSKQWYFTLSSHQFALTYFKFSPFSLHSSPTQFLFIQNKNNFYLFSYNDDVSEEIGSVTDDCNKNLFKLGINFHDDELVLVGSCNGLVCLASFSSYYFLLWNPITGQFRKYLDPNLSVYSSCNCRVSWGFGYVSSTDDYKVVRILEFNATLEIRVHVFSLKLNKWTRISDELYQDMFSLGTTKNEVVETVHGEAPSRFLYSFHSRQGILVNETLYWIVSDTRDWSRKIIAFYLVVETFDTIVDLNLVSNDVYWDKFLCAMGGCLSKCGVNKRDDVYIDILKGPGKVDSILLSRDLRLRSCQSLYGFTRTGKMFILLEDSTIGLVDPRLQPMKHTPLLTFNNLGKSRVATYVPSLISPCTFALL